MFKIPCRSYSHIETLAGKIPTYNLPLSHNFSPHQEYTTHPTTKMTKTFFSLPIELRQKILYSTFDTTYTIPVRPIPEDEDQDDFINRYGQLFNALHNWEDELKNCSRVVENLMNVCKDSRMKEDVRYIAHTRIEELAKLLWEMIRVHQFVGDRDFELSRENSRERAARTMMKISKAIGGKMSLKARE